MFNNVITLGSNIVVEGFRSLTYILDLAVYLLAKVVYQVFYAISSASLLNGRDDMINRIAMRVYVVLGILMFFILAWNLLNYIVDPDKINDKKVGASTFIKDVVIALVIISMSPLLFTKLYSLQNEILTSNAIGTLILGGSGADANVKYEPDEVGDSLADYYVKNGANNMIADIYVSFLYPKAVDGVSFTALQCGTEAEETQGYQLYCDAYREVKKDGDLIHFSDFIDSDAYTFTPLLSTAAGLVLMFLLLGYCTNLAKRVGKMAILQFLAPIPCAMELLPNKKGTRDNWIKTLIQVYCEVFVFQATIYLIIFLISLIPDALLGIQHSVKGINWFVTMIATVILIFGLLMFAKDIPKMVFDLLGIKPTGSLKEAIGMGAVAGGVGLIGSTVGNFARNFNATDGNIGKKLLSGVAGAGSGIGRNLWGAHNVKNWKDASTLRKTVNQGVTTARVKRAAYAHAHDNKFSQILKGHAGDMLNTVDSKFRGFTGYQGRYLPKSTWLAMHPGKTVSDYETYQSKRERDDVLSRYKKLYKENVASIWESDSKYQNYKVQYDEALRKGDKVAAEQAMNDMLAARQNALKANKTKLMEAAGRLNNFIDANQGIDGITTKRLDLNQALLNPDTYINTIDDLVVGEKLTGNVVSDGKGGYKFETTAGASGDGYDKRLKDLSNDATYQQDKVMEKLDADAKEATRKAAEQASNKDKK